jgi:hypothetical protein
MVGVLAALTGAFGCGGRDRAARGRGATVALRYHPPIGTVHHYALEQRSEVTIEASPTGAKPPQVVTVRVRFHEAVTGPPGAAGGVTLTLDSVRIESPDVTAHDFEAALAGLQGSARRFTYDDRGTLTPAELPAPAAAPDRLSVLSGRLWATLTQLTFALPDAPVGVGDSWTSQLALPVGPGPAAPKIRTQLTVKEIRAAGPDTSVLLAFTTTFPAAPFTVTQGRPGALRRHTLSLTGRMTGEELVALGTGSVVRLSKSGRFSVEATGTEGELKTSTRETTSLRLSDGP